MAIYSCKGCVAPKRYPGCHDRCPEYLAEKAKHDEQTAAEAKRRYIEYGIISQLRSGVRRANMISHKKG